MLAMFLVYLASNIEGIIKLFGTMAFVCGIFAGGWIFFYCVSAGEAISSPFKSKLAKWAMALCVTFSFISALLPKERTVYMMAGAYMGQSVIQSETGKKIGNILEKKLDKYLEEMDTPVQLPALVNEKVSVINLKE